MTGIAERQKRDGYLAPPALVSGNGPPGLPLAAWTLYPPGAYAREPLMTKPFVTSLLLLACLLLSACEKDWGVDQHGQEITAAHLQGKWLLINYWAEWCGPCRTEIPELNTLAMSEHNLEVLGVNFDELRGEELAEAAEALGIRFRVLSDDPAERLKLSRSEVLPVTYLVDDKGAVRERLIGEQSAAGILAHLERLRGE